MKRVLVANRGEIAVRILRACREAGLETVAVFSDADEHAPHIALADEAWRLGPGPAAESYLDQRRLLEVAAASRADALHPGYGFLSENAAFAHACEEAGLTFVGPPSSAIRLLGDKSQAKRVMEEAGVPVVPGYHGEDQSEARLFEEARLLGAPVAIKATAGGGGRGMRVVSDLGDFAHLLREAKQEADAAFGDDRVLLERYVVRPRHVEIQIFADRFGGTIHLGERECSIQRRHQKIVEESPSPAMTSDLRAAMGSAAVRAAKASGYVNAGTVEFLLETTPEGPRFYFLEVNTRLQVEHPVTELVTGLDLVRMQLAIAAGERLHLDQDAVTFRGHAIEVRIYAEDCAAGFLPSIGTLVHWRPPDGPGVRVDSGVRTLSEVSPYYDSMLAKLIVSAETRPAAIQRLRSALSEFAVLGVQTNIAYLLDIVANEAFVAGDTHTGFLAQEFSGWQETAPPPPAAILAAALGGEAPCSPAGQVATLQERAVPSPWTAAQSWRNA